METKSEFRVSAKDFFETAGMIGPLWLGHWSWLASFWQKLTHRAAALATMSLPDSGVRRVTQRER